MFALQKLHRELGITLYAVHINHGIRPDAARDAAYVEELCGQLEVPFTLVEADVRAYAREQGCSSEEAGREVRYAAFFRELERRQAQKIAVAHNAGDRAETLLFHLFRGTGLAGLSSIRPVRDRVVRPLLGLERSDIEAYLKRRQIRFCQDSTNETDAYTRNRIRHHILPYAEQEICSGATVHLCRTADIFSEIEDYMEGQIRQARESCVLQEQPQKPVYEICCDAFGILHPAMQKGLLLSLLKDLSPAHKDMGIRQVEQVLELCRQPGNRRIRLPRGISAGRSYDRVVLERQEAEEHRPPECRDGGQPALQLPVPQLPGEVVSCQVPGGVLRMKYLNEREAEAFLPDPLPETENDKKSLKFPVNQYTKWLDYDKIEKLLEWRNRRTGDYLEIRTPSGYGRKTIKSLLIDEKVPQRERDCIPMLAQGNHILWVVGGRICESCKLSGETKRILEVQYTPGATEEILSDPSAGLGINDVQISTER
ncbi:MAG: tRNA lysidine(34) synthetase TilS [Lachnospiraceae bacterium]|nr:tRNA lysidine(34) synthetase TilS [Lachnospiraceae bacterium]